ncbi:MAG: DUF1254 domain-containing protein [Methyloligellaceae bacterium]
MSSAFCSYIPRLLFLKIFTLIILLSTGFSYGADIDRATAKRIGVKAYIYGFPILLMDRTSKVMTSDSSGNEGRKLNRLRHIQILATPAFRAVIRPNNDTLYSSAFLNLKKEPVILTIPEVKDRYASFTLLDAWTNAFATRSSRILSKNTTTKYPVQVAITGPDWKGTLPANTEQIKSPTNLVWLQGRTEVKGQADIGNVIAIQNKYGLSSLSSYNENRAPQSEIRPASAVKQKMTPEQQVRAMDAKAFYTTLAKLITENPPPSADREMLKDLAEIGIIPGKNFDFATLPPEIQQGLGEATTAAQEFLRLIPGRFSNDAQWRPDLTKVKLGEYGTRYTLRAIVADTGFGAIKREDAVYQTARKDTDGNILSGTNQYKIQFPKGKIPPVKGFWSLTIYDKEGFLVANTLSRYSIGSNSKLQYNRDGSLDIFIQHTPPASDKQSNWLPAPSGPFEVTLRMYWPEPAILDGSWKMPALETLN